MIVAAVTIVAVAVTTVAVSVVMLALPFPPRLKSSGIWIHTLGVRQVVCRPSPPRST